MPIQKEGGHQTYWLALRSEKIKLAFFSSQTSIETHIHQYTLKRLQKIKFGYVYFIGNIRMNKYKEYSKVSWKIWKLYMEFKFLFIKWNSSFNFICCKLLKLLLYIYLILWITSKIRRSKWHSSTWFTRPRLPVISSVYSNHMWYKSPAKNLLYMKSLVCRCFAVNF